jgi:membrane-associated phospholipid phosphatase
METTPKDRVPAPARRLELRPFEHFTERAVAGLIAVAAAGTGFAMLLLLVRLNWEPLEHLDHGAAAGLNRLVAGHDPVVTVLRAITTMGGHTILWWLVTVGAVGLLLRRQPQLAAYLVVTGLGALALDPILKLIVGRLRPVVANPVAAGQGNSFPSGHALGSIVAYGALLLVFLPTIPRRARLATTIGTGVLVVAIGFTRIALGVHYVSDVLGGWLLGVAWLGVTAYTFRLWRRETGQREPDLSAGLAPEAARALVPARAEHPRHPWRAAAELLVAAVLVLGALFGLGTLVTRYPAAFDKSIPIWFAQHRTPGLTPLSHFWSQAGNTHAILAVGLIAGPLALMATRRWRPVVYLVVTMFGELALFLATAHVLNRERPPVSQMDGQLPTSSFPSGHVAATVCLYGAIAVLVMARTRHWWRWLTVGLAVFMPIMVILARLYRGEHHPTDIAGGVLLALAWLTAVTYVVRPNADLQRRRPSGEPGDDTGESAAVPAKGFSAVSAR